MLNWLRKLLRKVRQTKDDNTFLLTVHIDHDDLQELIENGFTEFNGIEFDYYQNTMLTLKDNDREKYLKYYINKALINLLMESYNEKVGK
jgi:F0F1-type ATP synthase delta subunit